MDIAWGELIWTSFDHPKRVNFPEVREKLIFDPTRQNLQKPPTCESTRGHLCVTKLPVIAVWTGLNSVEAQRLV